jgi:hypothetical protein
MARPGLEPGTPRFSVVRSKPSNPTEHPANKRVPQVASRARIPVDSILSLGIRAMTAISSPFPTELAFGRSRSRASSDPAFAGEGGSGRPGDVAGAAERLAQQPEAPAFRAWGDRRLRRPDAGSVVNAGVRIRAVGLLRVRRVWFADQCGTACARRSTASKRVVSCVPSQKGFVLEWPQRQRAIVSLTW